MLMLMMLMVVTDLKAERECSEMEVIGCCVGVSAAGIGKRRQEMGGWEKQQGSVPDLVPMDVVVAFGPHGFDNSVLLVFGDISLNPGVQGHQEIDEGLLVPDRHVGDDLMRRLEGTGWWKVRLTR